VKVLQSIRPFDLGMVAQSVVRGHMRPDRSMGSPSGDPAQTRRESHLAHGDFRSRSADRTGGGRCPLLFAHRKTLRTTTLATHVGARDMRCSGGESAKAFAGAQIKGDTGPPPVVDQHLRGNESLRARRWGLTPGSARYPGTGFPSTCPAAYCAHPDCATFPDRTVRID